MVLNILFIIDTQCFRS